MKSTGSVIFLIFLSIFLTSCKSDLKTVAFSSKKNEDFICKAKSKASHFELSIYEKSRTKVFKEEFIENQKTLLNQKNIISKGTEIIVIANPECLIENKNLGWVSKKISSQIRIKTNLNERDYFWFQTEKDIDLEELELSVNQDSCIYGISPNRKLELQSFNDEKYSLQNNLKQIQHDKVSLKILNSIKNPVLVGVVDSGNEQNHEDMVGRHWRNKLEENGTPGIDDDGNGYIDDIYGYSWACYIGGDRPASFWAIPHGEHVAGIIAANMNNNIGISGIAGQKSQIMHLNVVYSGSPLGCGPSGPQDLVLAIEAIKYAADNGVKVINLSMGNFGRSSAMEDVMRYAVSKGVFVASAAGNNNRELNDQENFFYPCGYAKNMKGYMCVGAIDSQPSSNRCGFSNFNSDFVEIAAPGCDSSVGQLHYGIDGVLSTVRESENPKYKYMPGTSMATPHIAAAAALVIGYIESKTGSYPDPSLVEEILFKSSKKMSHLENQFKNGATLNLKSMFEYVDNLFQENPEELCP